MKTLLMLAALLVALMSVPAHAAVPGANGPRVRASTEKWSGACTHLRYDVENQEFH